MSYLYEIAAKLEALSLGALGASIKVGKMGDSPDACCCVYPTGGIPPQMGFGVHGVDIETPGFQVVFRGAAHDFDGPNDKAVAALSGLAKVEVAILTATAGNTLTSALYHWIHPQQSQPFVMKLDESQRFYLVADYLAEKKLSA